MAAHEEVGAAQGLPALEADSELSPSALGQGRRPRLAAIVMVCVFSVFGALQILFLKEFGVALAAAILIDAPTVRAFLLPATMKLLGDWNWYLPSWLEWLPLPARGAAVGSALRGHLASRARRQRVRAQYRHVL